MLSVIVPIYNSEKYLDKCIESLLNQTYSDIELVLVDDGSNDGSPGILDRYAQEYGNIKVVHTEKGGQCAARNNGIKHASGDIIAFMDADDVIDPQIYEILINALYLTDSDVAACGMKTEYGLEIRCSEYTEIPQPRIFVSKKELFAGVDNGIAGFVWNKVIEKETIGDIRFREDLNFMEDLYFTYEIMAASHRACCVDLPMYHYRYNIQSITHSASIDKYMKCLSTFQHLIEWIDNDVPECSGSLHRNYLFWNTKACENMLNDYHPMEFRTIQGYVFDNREYISQCGLRIRLLCNAILNGWNAYRPLGKFFFILKKVYVSAVRLVR